MNIIARAPRPLWAVIVWGVTTAFASADPIPAFPGAEGFGAYAEGGRGGVVIEVTNLNDSGPGSLRAACIASGPRIVVFRVSGTIALQSNLNVTNPYITIAGQTAPGDGICLKNFQFTILADHVIVRHIRSRPGDNASSPDDPVDAISVWAGHDIIIDHCSASWSVDETLSVASQDPAIDIRNVTVQWCIISESLNDSIHPDGRHGYGSLIRGRNDAGITYHHNLYAHHNTRCPRPGAHYDVSIDPDGLRFDFRNNVIYNFKDYKAGYNGDGNAMTRMNYVGNYIKTGPSTGNLDGVSYAYREECKVAETYIADNFWNTFYPADQWSIVYFRGFTQPQIDVYKARQPTPHSVAFVTTDDAVTAYNRVLAGAGATLPNRDPVDTRVINDVVNGTGDIIDDEDEVGGWPILASAAPPVDSDHDGMPDSWESEHDLDPNDASDGPLDDDGNGYTNVEEYLNGLTLPQPTAPSPADQAFYVPTDTMLGWNAVPGATGYNVYLGTSADPPLHGTTATTSYDPGRLLAGTTYYWHVEAIISGQPVAGGDWTFTTDDVSEPVTVTNLNRYELTNFTVGSTYYSDRTYTITSMPAYLDGELGIRTANDDKGVTSTPWITFDVDVETTVFIAFDRRATSLPNWMADFADTGVTIGVTDSGMQFARVYAKTFPAGSIVLGGPAAPGAAGTDANYFVLLRGPVVSEGVAPSDFDADHDVDVADFAHFQVCFSGAANPPIAGCTDADLDGDTDVDVADFARFSLCFSGAQQPSPCAP